jgi:hypothetical protein
MARKKLNPHHCDACNTIEANTLQVDEMDDHDSVATSSFFSRVEAP